MRTRVTTALALLGGVAILAQPPARAEHFDITLSLVTSQGRAEARWDTSPPEGGVNPRQSVRAKVGELLPLEWSLRSEYPHGTMKRVTIQLYVVREQTLGQKKLPPAGTPRLFSNRFQADFLPHHSARGVVNFRIKQPGSYLVRLESEETLKGHGHEHFAALDVQVE